MSDSIEVVKKLDGNYIIYWTECGMKKEQPCNTRKGAADWVTKIYDEGCTPLGDQSYDLDGLAQELYDECNEYSWADDYEEEEDD